MKKLELLRLLRSHIQDRCWYERQTSQQTGKDQTPQEGSSFCSSFLNDCSSFHGISVLPFLVSTGLITSPRSGQTSFFLHKCLLHFDNTVTLLTLCYLLTSQYVSKLACGHRDRGGHKKH